MYNLFMDVKFLRMLIRAFSWLIAVFVLLILVNYTGNRFGSRQEAAAPGALFRQVLPETRYGGGAGGASMIPVLRRGLSTEAVKSEGAMMVVKEKDFSGVAEPPEAAMAMLNEMGGGGKKKPAPVVLKESDLDKKIMNIGGGPVGEPRLKGSSMPELGRGAGQEGVTLLSAPVDYKIFKSSEIWWSFSNSRRLSPGPHDFSVDNLLILVSLSDFPSGIFNITGVERGKKETVVSYRVNPLIMAAEISREQREAYASVPVPKDRPVRLQQIP